MAYATREQLEARFSAAEIKQWADRDSDGDATAIASAITAALDDATAEIDDRLRGGPYSVPFSSPPTIIVRTCCMIAAGMLYEPRGAQDFGEVGEPLDRLHGVRKKAELNLRRIRAGVLRLDLDEEERTPFVRPTTLHRDEATTLSSDGFTFE